MTLPFELPKHHIYKMKHVWKKRGVVFDNNFNEIYDRYINSSQCELCNKIYEKRQHRQLDHCHITGKFRNVVCQNCNKNKREKFENTTGFLNISKSIDKNYSQGYSYRITINRNKKTILSTTRTTLEDAIKCRDEFIKNNPQHFI
jgi:hypothetical protein